MAIHCRNRGRGKKICGNFGNAITEIGEGKKIYIVVAEIQLWQFIAEIQLWQFIAEIGEGEKKFVAILAMPLPK